jgi:hypothetical protein
VPVPIAFVMPSFPAAGTEHQMIELVRRLDCTCSFERMIAQFERMHCGEFERSGPSLSAVS